MKNTIGIAAKGCNELAGHREGENLTRAQAIKAKCYDCMGGYTDGKGDCAVPDCPLYGYMPYRKTGLNLPVTPKNRVCGNAEKTRVESAG